MRAALERIDGEMDILHSQLGRAEVDVVKLWGE